MTPCVCFRKAKTYKASTTLAPEAESMGSNVGGIAEMMGVSLGSSVDAISVEMFPDVALSLPLHLAMCSNLTWTMGYKVRPWTNIGV